jgi:hypothetical protein
LASSISSDKTYDGYNEHAPIIGNIDLLLMNVPETIKTLQKFRVQVELTDGRILESETKEINLI